MNEYFYAHKKEHTVELHIIRYSIWTITITKKAVKSNNKRYFTWPCMVYLLLWHYNLYNKKNQIHQYNYIINIPLFHNRVPFILHILNWWYSIKQNIHSSKKEAKVRYANEQSPNIFSIVYFSQSKKNTCEVQTLILKTIDIFYL